jgi:hypothetical protein
MTHLLLQAANTTPARFGWGWGWFWIAVAALALIAVFSLGGDRGRRPRSMR